MPPADHPNPGATSKSGANDQSSDTIIHVANGATVEYIKNNTAIRITNSDSSVKKYRILPRPPNVSGPGLQEKMRCKGTKAVKSHNNYLDFQTKVRADTMTALKGKTDIKWKDCPLEAKASVSNALKYRHPYCFWFENNWAGEELMWRVLANKRDTLNNKTPKKRAEATERKLKAKGKQPATRANSGDEVPSITAGAETSDTEGNPERTVNPDQTPNQAEPNKGKDGDEDDINSDKEVERCKETNCAKPRPKMIPRTETGEAPEGPTADKPDSSVPSTVGRTSSPGPSGTTVASDTIGGSSKKRKTPDEEELVDSEDEAPVKPTKKTKTSQAKGKETEKNAPVEVPVPTASAAKAGKNNKQKLPAAETDDSEGKEEVARPTKKANTAKKLKAMVIQDEETNLEEDDSDTIIPAPAANTTENKKKAAANKGEKVAPSTRKRKEPEPNSSDLLEDEGEDEVEVEGEDEVEEPVVPKPNGKNSKPAAGAKANGKKQTLAQQNSWNAGYDAEVAAFAQKTTAAQKQEAMRAANRAAKEAQVAADKAAKAAKAAKAIEAAQLDGPSTSNASAPKRRKNGKANAAALATTRAAKEELIESVVRPVRKRTQVVRH